MSQCDKLRKSAKINLKPKSKYAYILHTVISRLHVFFFLWISTWRWYCALNKFRNNMRSKTYPSHRNNITITFHCASRRVLGAVYLCRICVCHLYKIQSHSRGLYSSTLFNNPNSHRTVERLMITCSKNCRNLFKANLNSQLFCKFRGLWTKE